MRIWRFYLISDKTSEYESRRGRIGRHENLTDKEIRELYPLYAITNNKKKAQEFAQQRNKDLFVMQSSKGFEQEEWTTYANKHRGAVLEYHKLLTDKGDEISVVMPYNEWVYVDGVVDDGNFLSILYPHFQFNQLPPPIIFKEKYQKLLYETGYIDLFKGLVGEPDGDPQYAWSVSNLIPEKYCGYEIIELNGVKINTLEVFLSAYGELFDSTN